MPADGSPPIRPTWRDIVMLAGGFFAVCTAFAAAITAKEAWQEHVQALWPVATAQIQSCQVDFAFSEERYVYIACSVRYFAEKETIESIVTSRKARAPNKGLISWPRNQVGEVQMQSWVQKHPGGTSIQVHYDPAKPAKVALAESDMPLGHATASANVRLVGILATITVPILALGLIVRRR